MTRTVSVAAARLGTWLDGFADRHGPWQVDASESVVELTGADGDKACVHVPFPPLTDLTVRGLLAHVKRPRRVGVLLVRRGGYAVGIFEGTQLVSSKVGSSYVQGTTKAGGWSQQRYARRRANQADAAFAEAADVAVRILGGQALDAVVLGGDRPAVKAVLSDVRLESLNGLVTGGWLTVKDPKLRVLEAMPAQYLAVQVELDP